MRLLTPPGVAGVAVVLVEAQEREALGSCLKTLRGTPWREVPHRAPQLAMLVLEGVPTDEVLVVDCHDGRLELHLHGAPAVLTALRSLFAMPLATPLADPAGRLLLEALGPEQLDLALEQQRQPFRAFLRGLAVLSGPERREAVCQAVQRSHAALALVQPTRLVLIGAQNAGKSTLFNCLLFRERVLTGPMPGLTRDPVAERTTLAGYPYELVDTAGEGPSDAEVDREAIEAGRALRADGLVLLVVDSSRGPSDLDRDLVRQGAWAVASKADLPMAPWPADFPCHLRLSCLEGASATVRSTVGEFLRTVRALPQAGPVGGPAALDQRQLAELDALRTSAKP